MQIYYYEGEGDQRLPHEGPAVPVDEVRRLGVLTWQISSDPVEAQKQIDEIAQDRSYKNRDQITVSREAMGEAYEQKVKSFFHEHLHEDEEIRYIVDGEGYFDVRDKDDRWIRIAMQKNDLAVLPAGIFHRFTTGESNFITAMRLFKEEPKWTPLNRNAETEQNKYRTQYVQQISS